MSLFGFVQVPSSLAADGGTQNPPSADEAPPEPLMQTTVNQKPVRESQPATGGKGNIVQCARSGSKLPFMLTITHM